MKLKHPIPGDAEEEPNVPLGDRRDKSRVAYTSALSGVGSFGIGVFILNMLTQQNGMLHEHSRWIQENSEGQKEVMTLLNDMRSQFAIDINTFKLRHENLEEDMGDFSSQQRVMLERLAQVERDLVTQKQVSELEAELKEWVQSTFAERKVEDRFKRRDQDKK